MCVHHEKRDADSGNSDFGDHKHAITDLEQTGHQVVGLVRAAGQQGQGEHGIQATQEQYRDTGHDDTRLVIVKVVAVILSACLATAASAVQAAIGDRAPAVTAAVCPPAPVIGAAVRGSACRGLFLRQHNWSGSGFRGTGSNWRAWLGICFIYGLLCLWLMIRVYLCVTKYNIFAARPTLGSTSDIVEKISSSIQLAAEGSVDISSSMEEISSSAEEQTASMEEISATAEKLGLEAQHLKEQLSQQESNRSITK